MKLIAGISVTLLLLIVTSKAQTQTCTQIQGCDVTIIDSCYAYVDDSLNRNQAEDCCVAWGGHLASIHSFGNNEILNNIRNQSRCTWIGLSYTANVSEYAWSDGTPNDYNNYYSGPPGSNGEVCFHYRIEDSDWYDYDCSSDTYVDQEGISYPITYICQKRQFTSVCENRVISDVSVTRDICYEESLATDMRDWNSAFNNCSSTNRRLARVLNEEMSVEIERITQNTDEYWIGLYRPNGYSEFMWSDGTSVSDTRWSSGHPTDGLNCVSVRGNSNEWYSSDCSESKRYVCERDVCVGWTVRNGICYRRFDTASDVNTAISVCRSQNAYLAEIPNIYVDNVITGIIGHLGGGGGGGNTHWIGLRTSDTHYYWRIGDFSLGNDTPSDSDMNRCGAVDSDFGNSWIIRDCNDKRHTICMIGPLTNEIPIERCENSSADTLVYEDSCYTRITVNRINLDRATLTCTDYYNGTLYDLSDTTVNEEIRGKFGNGSDLSIVDPNEYRNFTAQDGYFNLFTSDGGNNYSNCATINSVGVLSNSGSCPGNDDSYICKRNYTPHFNILKEITFNETLYQLIAHDGNFDEARNYCNNQKGTNDMNGHLMEILNQRQQQVLLNLTSTVNQYVDEYYWIGLEYTNSDYVWTSGEIANYIENITNLTDADSYCVAVDRDGKWLGLDCSDRYSFICQRPHVLSTAVTNATNMLTSTATSMTTNMSTSAPTSMTTTMSTTMSTSAPTMNAEIDCSQNPATAVCATLLDLTYEPILGMDQFIQREMSLEVLSNSTIGIGQIARGFNEMLQAEILVANVGSNTSRTFTLDNVILKINDQSFENNAIVTSAVYNSTNYANIASKVITIIASERLAGNLTMIFTLINQTEGTTLMCSSYTINSEWINDGITTKERESTIECTTNHLTTFAVTQVVKVTISDTIDCSKPNSKDISFCNILEVIDQISTQQELISTPQSQSNNTAVMSLQNVDEYLESILLLFNVTTGVRLEIVQPQQVLVIIGIRQNETTSVPVGENVVTANPDSFPDDTVLIVLSTSFNDTRKFTNDSFRIVSDIITIQASNELEGNLTITFTLRKELKMDNYESIRQRVFDNDYYCAFLESNGTWSRITTQTTNSSTIQCITTHLTVFALLSTSSICNASIGEIHKALLQATSYTLLSVSFLFLIATIITFLYSWKQVFRIDINILNFNHSVVLSLAIFMSIIGTELASKNPIVCHVSAFFIHFLWSSVFLSSLSITILVFYSIWIVGIKHQARKLSPYLIPISWTISGIWALIWLPVGLVDNTYINNNTYANTECTEPCVLSTDSKLIYAFILPIIVIICVNLCILFLNLGRIRKVFKNSDRNEMEIVRLRKVAFGGLLLVPSLGIQFLLSIPLSFSPLYIKTDKYAYIILQWVSLISTGTIGITHFLLVTYQTPEVRLPKFVRSNSGESCLHPKPHLTHEFHGKNLFLSLM